MPTLEPDHHHQHHFPSLVSGKSLTKFLSKVSTLQMVSLVTGLSSAISELDLDPLVVDHNKPLKNLERILIQIYQDW